eukprot:s701_g24.t1
MGKFQGHKDASESALAIDAEDHKAWYRKVQAEKGLGKFKEAEESLAKLEDVAQWCPDRRRILRDCEQERTRIKNARVKHKQSTQEMLGRAFQAGVFSLDRDRELEEATKKLEEPAMPRPQAVTDQRKPLEARPLERNIQLTAALAGDLMDELATAYVETSSQSNATQERVRKCARDSGYERSVFLMRLKDGAKFCDVAFEVQKPVLEKWGFEGNEHGVREMTAAIREHAGKNGKEPFLRDATMAQRKARQVLGTSLWWEGRRHAGHSEMRCGMFDFDELEEKIEKEEAEVKVEQANSVASISTSTSPETKTTLVDKEKDLANAVEALAPLQEEELRGSFWRSTNVFLEQGGKTLETERAPRAPAPSKEPTATAEVEAEDQNSRLRDCNSCFDGCMKLMRLRRRSD